MTLFLAGHETTALVLSWTWYLLSQHPEVEARLANEVQSVLGGRSAVLLKTCRSFAYWNRSCSNRCGYIRRPT